MDTDVNTFKQMAEAGYSLIPLKNGGKEPIKGFNKWTHKGPTSVAELEGYLKKYKGCNMGVVATGLYILDIDDPLCAWFQRRNSEIKCIDPPPMFVKSASVVELEKMVKGRLQVKEIPCGHIYFQAYEEYSQGCDIKGIDVKCCGKGYVVAPGSVHKDKRYTTKQIMPKDELPYIQRHMVPSRTTTGITNVESQGLVWDDKKFKPGARNNRMAQWVGWVVSGLRKQCDDGRVEAIAMGLNQVKCDPPLPEHEILLMVKSIKDAEFRKQAEREASRIGLDKI